MNYRNTFALGAVLMVSTGAQLGAQPHDQSGSGNLKHIIASTEAADKLLNADKLEEARSAYSAAIKASPKLTTARIGLLRCLLRMDLWKEGLTATREGEKAIPDCASFKGFESLFLMRGADPDAALTAADAAVKAGKDDYWCMVAKGRALAWQYREDEARTLLNQAIEKKPDALEAYRFLATTYSARQGLETEKLEQRMSKMMEARRDRPTPKTPEEAEKIKAKADQRKAESNERLKFYETLAANPPLQMVSPTNEAQIAESDAGKAAPVSFTFPIERGVGEGGKDDILIPVTVDGVRLKMLFDTGAGHAFALGQLPAARLNLPVLARSAVEGVNGVERTKMHLASKLTIGKQVFKSVPIESIDNKIGENQDGLIGGAVFDKYVVTVDCKENTMTLTRGKDARAPAPIKGNRIVEVPFHDMNGYIYVRISVDNHKWWTILDTGAERYGVISLDVARMLAKEHGKSSAIELKVQGRVGVGISQTSYTVLVFTFPIDVGCLVEDRTPYFIQMDELYGASIIDKLSDEMDFNVAGLLGVSYLASRCSRFSIDYPHHILTMEQPDE